MTDPSGPCTADDLILRYRRARAEVRYLIAREVTAFYLAFTPKPGGVSVRVQWRSPRVGWTPVIEPGPYALPLTLSSVSASLSKDWRDRQLCSVTWHYIRKYFKNGRWNRVFDEHFPGSVLPKNAARQSIYFRTDTADIVDWNDPKKRAIYNERIEEFVERHKRITALTELHASLRQDMLTSYCAILRMQKGLQRVAHMVPATDITVSADTPCVVDAPWVLSPESKDRAAFGEFAVTNAPGEDAKAQPAKAPKEGVKAQPGKKKDPQECLPEDMLPEDWGDEP